MRISLWLAAPLIGLVLVFMAEWMLLSNKMGIIDSLFGAAKAALPV